MANNFLSSGKLSFNSLHKLAQRNQLLINILFVAVILGGGSWYGYRYYSLQKEEAATTILDDCLNEYQTAAQGKTSWATVTAMCEAGYEKYKNSGIAPYILAVEIDALLHDQKNEEALKVLERMIASLAHESPLRAPYQLKYALLKMDMLQEKMNDPQFSEAGLQELQALAYDTKNMYADAALYYLGLYYFSNENEEKAREVWKTLITNYDTHSAELEKSPWVTLAKAKGLV